jgi:hypothetical protein
MFERRLYFHVDWAMLAAILALCLIGLVQIYSATAVGPDASSRIYVTQIYGIVLGMIALVICLSIDYRSLADKSHWIYLGIIVLLIYVLFFGVVRGGSRRWINLHYLHAAAVGVCQGHGRARARQVLRRQPGAAAVTSADLLIGAAIVAVPLLMIYKQPDLGTGGDDRAGRSWRLRSLPAAAAASSASWHSSGYWRRRSPGCLRSRTINGDGSRRFSTLNGTREAPGISRFRPALRPGLVV